MNKKNLFTSVVLGIALGAGVYAHNPGHDNDEFDINTIVYLEDEEEIDLGFDTADYLPEDFDPYSFYIDLNTVVFIENEETEIYSSTNLPKDFNAYGYPVHFRHISYIDPEEPTDLDFDTQKHLPEGFDPYIRK
jgi:hypothetical protein